jgi:hypothetical protein
VQFGHIVEVHPIDPGEQNQWHDIANTKAMANKV